MSQLDQHSASSPIPNHLDGDNEDQLTLRMLVSTKEAGVIIGKAGKNVAELREVTGVKAGVSKVIQGVHNRVLAVSGPLDAVTKAYSLIAQILVDNPIPSTPASPPISPVPSLSDRSESASVTLRLLISHNMMGTVIGRQGVKIKHIQAIAGVRMMASKTLLPQSTERVVEVRGTVDGIPIAVWEIGRCLIDDKERSQGTILYNPAKAEDQQQEQDQQQQQQQQQQRRPSSSVYNNNGGDHSRSSSSSSSRRRSSLFNNNGMDYSQPQAPPQPASRRSSTQQQQEQPETEERYNLLTQHISIPSDMVGCIIGKGGRKITEIRQLSGSRISIAKDPHDESGERLFRIQGSTESNERALYLLYEQLEHEKERRLRRAMQEEDVLGGN